MGKSLIYLKRDTIKANVILKTFFEKISEIYEPKKPSFFDSPIFYFVNENGGDGFTDVYFLYKNIITRRSSIDYGRDVFTFEYDDEYWECKDSILEDMQYYQFGLSECSFDFFARWFTDMIEYDVRIPKDCKVHKNFKTYLMNDSNTGFTKIGKSVNPRVREKTLQSEKPTIELFAICDDDIEDYLHNVFSEYRVRGEWFNLSQNQINTIIEKHAFKIQK